MTCSATTPASAPTTGSVGIAVPAAGCSRAWRSSTRRSGSCCRSASAAAQWARILHPFIGVG
ncbi:MAG: hypothetical protein MZW92_73375 [Comamonadaceae bacterium]|nr:hypothetical protein [Comamonadaceae bacterium]